MLTFIVAVLPPPETVSVVSPVFFVLLDVIVLVLPLPLIVAREVSPIVHVKLFAS